VDKVLRYLGEGQLSIDNEQRTIPMPRPPAPGEVPYKGLQYFTENDSYLFYGRESCTARLWDARGLFIAALEAHISWLNSADFSPDGSRILTTSWDGTARMWYGYANVSAMATEAVRRVGRSLTPLECKTYLYLDRCP